MLHRHYKKRGTVIHHDTGKSRPTLPWRTLALSDACWELRQVVVICKQLLYCIYGDSRSLGCWQCMLTKPADDNDGCFCSPRYKTRLWVGTGGTEDVCHLSSWPPVNRTLWGRGGLVGKHHEGQRRCCQWPLSFPGAALSSGELSQQLSPTPFQALSLVCPQSTHCPSMSGLWRTHVATPKDILFVISTCSLSPSPLILSTFTLRYAQEASMTPNPSWWLRAQVPWLLSGKYYPPTSWSSLLLKLHLGSLPSYGSGSVSLAGSPSYPLMSLESPVLFAHSEWSKRNASWRYTKSNLSCAYHITCSSPSAVAFQFLSKGTQHSPAQPGMTSWYELWLVQSSYSKTSRVLALCKGSYSVIQRLQSRMWFTLPTNFKGKCTGIQIIIIYDWI